MLTTVTTRALAAALLCTINLHAPAASAKGVQAPSWESRYDGRLIVEFEGGLVTKDLADVLARFSKLYAAIPWKPHTFQLEDRDACTLLQKALKILSAHCSEQTAKALMAFSAAHGKAHPANARLKVGEVVALPDIEAETYSFFRTFDIRREKQRRGYQAVTTSPAWKALLKERIDPTNSSIKRLEFTGLRWTVPLKSEQVLETAEVVAFDLNGPNLTAFVERSAKLRRFESKKFAQVSPADYYDRCSKRLSVEGIKGAYTAYFHSGDYDATSARQCRPLARPVQVYVIDSEIATSPDLPLRGVTPAIGPAAAAASCTTGNYTDLDHGTYLSGIVASRGDVTGLVGLNPITEIKNILWEKGSQDSSVRHEIGASFKNKEAQIFLFASQFNGIEEISNKEALRSKIWRKVIEGRQGRQLTEFTNPELRLSVLSINKLITHNIRPLFVVAAGQVDADQGDVLSFNSTMSPQNIGDFGNVIVVTACTNCQQDQAALWSNANYGAKDSHLIDIAAPGGEAIPGLIGEGSSIGEPKFGGTSAAAAFTAGVASTMLACHPDSYAADPARLKRQLLITSRANLRAEDQHKVPGGTIDPNLALINPETSWLKVAGQDGMVEIKSFKHWCTPALVLTPENGRDDAVALSQVQRITSYGSSYVLRSIVEKDIFTSTGFDLDVVGPGIAGDSGQAIAAVEIDGKGPCKLQLGDIQDLILKSEVAEDKKPIGLCGAALKRCFQ
jgi:hypothetical protein